ncbi:retrovirus-related pol polyprotein from transposon TNT 1-94 [Tanacetum coccineum]
MQQPPPDNNYNPQPSFNQNYMQQPMADPEDITDPITAMNMALVLLAKAFKLNYSTPTNNNQRISSNPCNRQIAQPSMNMGQDRQMQMVGGNGGNQFRKYAKQNVRNKNGYNAIQNVMNQVVQNAVQNLGVQNVGNQNGLIVVLGIANQNPNVNGNVVAARVEGNANGNNGNQKRCYNCRGLGHLARKCTVKPMRMDQASTSGTQTDKDPVYDSDGSADVIQICLWCVDSGCSKHMTGNLKLLINFVWKFLGTVRFRNDHVAAILGYGDLKWGNILITRVYFVKGLGHNLFSIGQFCDSDLEVAFRRNTCFVRNLEGVDLLKGNRKTNLYTINFHEMASVSPVCLMARATSTKSWLWHQRLSDLNFDTINDLAKNDLVTGLPKFKYHKEHLCPSCEQGKSKRASHPPKPVLNSKQMLHLLHMDLCGPMRVESINGKLYVLVIVDDYSRYTWVHFLRSKDEAPEEIKTFLKKITVLLQAPVIMVRTDNYIESKNQVLKEYFDSIGISHQASSRLLLLSPRNDSEDMGKTCAKSSGLNLTYAPSTITTQQPTERELDLLYKAMYDDYIGGQPSTALRHLKFFRLQPHLQQ